MSILDSLHRGVSIDVWSRLHDTENPPSIDQAFGAFDMFVVHEQPNDLDHISRWLDDAATSFQQTQESWHHAPTRTKALALVRWLRDQGFRGIQLEEDYRNLRNCFIGHVLSDPEHQSLPLVQAAIYVAVANRLGLDAACCNAPAHIHVVVSAPAGVDLDNNPLPEDSSTDRMYLDPYTSALELQSSDLEDRRQLLLHASPIPVSSAAFFDPSPLPPLVVRMASNIRHTYTLAKRLPQDSPTALSLKSLRAGDPEQNVELALYAALWSTLLSSPPQSPDWDAGLEFFLNRFALYYSEDSWIVERYLVPLYDRFVSRPANNNLEAGAARHRVGWENVREILRMLENLDARQPAVNRRYTAEIGRRVPYRIGQVFRHRRYGYIGVINGWAAAGLASLPTPHYVVDEEGDGDDAAADHDDGGAAARRDEWGATPAVRGPGRTYYTCL
jgi:F-box protein 21